MGCGHHTLGEFCLSVCPTSFLTCTLGVGRAGSEHTEGTQEVEGFLWRKAGSSGQGSKQEDFGTRPGGRPSSCGCQPHEATWAGAPFFPFSFPAEAPARSLVPRRGPPGPVLPQL